MLHQRRRPSAGRVLAVASLLPALAVAGWLLAGLPLLLAGRYTPLPATVLGLAVTALLARFALHRPGPLIETTALRTGAVLAVAAASGVFNALLHSEQLAVRRDPATYAQYAAWLAGHGSLPIAARAEAFGGADRALDFGSMGFYQVDGAVVPQFMPGAPLLFAAGDWLGAMLLTPAVLGAFAVLTLAGVVARLAGARWAPLAALAFAVCLPVLYTSRTTFSEIPSMILLFGGLALLHDALSRTVAAGRAGASRWGEGVVTGLVFGLAVLVRVDGLRDVLPVLAFAGLLIALRRFARPEGAVGPPLLVGLAAGAGLGLFAAYTLSRPYLAYLSRSVQPLLLICAAVLVLTAAGTAAAPWLARVRRPGWLPGAGAALVVLVMAGLAVRPWFQTVRRTPETTEDRRTARFIEEIQRANGLFADGERLYFEESLHWVAWYVGVPVVLLATLAAALLVRGLLQGRSSAWLAPLAVIGWTTLTTLLRPEITPDHPWAARRLVPVVIPGLVLLAVWGLGWVRDKAGDRAGDKMGGKAGDRADDGGRGKGRRRRWVAGAGALLVLVPPAVTSIGTAFTPVERGEAAAVAALCARIPPNAAVLVVERVTGERFTQVVRGMCGLPAARVRWDPDRDTAPEHEVRRLMDRVRAAGRVPVVLAAEAAQVAPYGPPRQVMALVTRQDERSLTGPPDGTWSLRINVWMAAG
ncbi:hypothetical protein FHU36_007314 [Nonomuraea muscovyensis]|uniref:Glycosyltransferase RgtA/B/C/D-like domain-containing protein n=1 Tax=Nonomuraea muscovyensis TaxID=1124761 RepID=A0A7X0C8Y9_9ACTN|nr:hypothetical protein [Nonomuraea muscovyensis]MBB6350742.1 hypothetical protein [Nonomuraea muscovyensis]